MERTISRVEVLKGYTSHFLNLAIGLILLPLILKYFDTKTISIWFSFITIGSLIQLFEFGLLPTIIRHISFLAAGSQISNRNQSIREVQSDNNKINIHDQISYIQTCKNLYGFLTLIIFVIITPLSILYLNIVYGVDQNLIFSITIFILSYVINIYFNWVSGIFAGFGQQEKNFEIIILQRVLIIIFTFLALSFKFGLLGVSIAFMASSLISRFFHYNLCIDKFSELFKSTNKKAFNDKYLFIEIIKTSFDLGIVQLATFLSQRMSILLLALYVDVESHSRYSLTITIIYTLFSFSSYYCNIQLPNLSFNNVSNFKKNKLIVKKIFLYSNILLFGAFLIVILFGNYLISYLNQSLQLIDKHILMILCFIVFLELNHSISAMIITTLNKVPFRNASVISSIGIVLAQISVVEDYQILGLILSIGVINLIYNNWKWPYYCYKEFN